MFTHRQTAPSRPGFGRHPRLALVALFTTIAMLVPLAPAQAHGDGETEEGYALVQQAIGHLVHDGSEDGVMAAMEKIDDALNTEDQEGVDVPTLEQAQAALEAGNVADARMLLQDSIAEAMAALPAATGEETGTTVISDPLEVDSDLNGLGGILLFGSIALLMLGIWLSWRFRPDDTVGALRKQIGGTPPRRSKHGAADATLDTNSSKEA